MTPRTDFTHRRYRVRTVILASATACAAVIGGATAAEGAPPANAHVPWNRLSHGWTMALWTAKGKDTARVYLVGPRGHRYPITGVSRSAYPVASSPDGKTVLLDTRLGLRMLDLRSGHRTTIKLPSGWVVGFTHDGRSLIEAVDVPHGEYLVSRLERFGLNGHHQVSFPMRASGAGRLDTSGVVALPGGRLATGAHHGVVVLHHNGTVARRLARNLRSCGVSSMWRKGVALARCNRGALWAVPLAGGHVTRLTDGSSKENPWGYSTAWRFSGGRLGLAQNGCGPDSLVQFGRNGHGNRITVPSPTGDRGIPRYIGHHGNVVDMMFSPLVGCSAGRNLLFAYNAVARTTRTLLGGAVNGGRVIGAMALGS